MLEKYMRSHQPPSLRGGGFGVFSALRTFLHLAHKKIQKTSLASVDSWIASTYIPPTAVMKQTSEAAGKAPLTSLSGKHTCNKYR
jgi:hypothetical protein